MTAPSDSKDDSPPGPMRCVVCNTTADVELREVFEGIDPSTAHIPVCGSCWADAPPADGSVYGP